MMTEAEEIGQYAVEVFRQSLPTQPQKNVRWVARELTGRDFGIDMAVEVFVGKEATGRILLFQIKGRKNEISWDDNDYFTYPHKVNNLLYAEKFNIPFILCLVELTSGNAYWLWMQSYIQLFLDPDILWRNQETKQVVFSKRQVVNDTSHILTHIAGHPHRMASIAILAGHTRQSRVQLGQFTESISLYLYEDYSLEHARNCFPGLKYYLEQVINNPIWNEEHFPAGQYEFEESVKPLKECLNVVEAFIDARIYPGRPVLFENTPVDIASVRSIVDPDFLISRLHTLEHLLNNIEGMITALNDVRFQRDMVAFEQGKST